MSRPARISLFWRFQLLGWPLFAIATIPLKIAAYHTVSLALLITVTREPIALILTTGLRYLYRPLRHRGFSALRLGAIVLGCSVVASALDTLLGREINRAFGELEDPLITFGIFCFRMSLYVVWSLLYFWISAQRAARERELNFARAETARREAELQLLRTQVNPHFLFNALNTILATLEPGQARPKRVVEGLASYLRYSLSHRHDSTVPLQAEYDAAVSYLAVEQERYGGELVVEASIDEAAGSFSVPGVLIQPLVENAIKYSRQTSEPPYRVRLRVTAPAPGTLTIEVANAGTWIEPSGAPGPHGTGLENLRRRLALLYPDRHRFEIGPAHGWVLAKLTIAESRLPAANPETPVRPAPLVS